MHYNIIVYESILLNIVIDYGILLYILVYYATLCYIIVMCAPHEENKSRSLLFGPQDMPSQVLELCSTSYNPRLKPLTPTSPTPISPKPLNPTPHIFGVWKA